MATNSQSRKWMMTINNPETCGLDQGRMREILTLFQPDYFCLADEIATTGTYHTHIFLYSQSPIRFSTVKKRFPTAHIEKAYTPTTEIISVRKENGLTPPRQKPLWRDFKSLANCPAVAQKTIPKCTSFWRVKSGFSTTEIIDESPSFAFVKDVRLRDIYQMEQFRSINRQIESFTSMVSLYLTTRAISNAILPLNLSYHRL